MIRLFSLLSLCIFLLHTPVMAADGEQPLYADQPLAAVQPQPAPQTPLFSLSYNEAEQSVAQALIDKGAGGKVTATINDRKADALFSYTQPLTAEIHGLSYDKPSGHWSASILVKADNNVITALPASGHFDEMIEVPVLKRQVRNGEVISASDIEIHDFPMTHTREDTITDIESLVGKSPLHSVSAFRPVREHEIVSPAMIKKNSLVQMCYHSEGMEITTSGQAMEDGAKGGVIAVRNMTSKKVVQAVVTDSSTVTVGPTEPEVVKADVGKPEGEHPYETN